MTVEKVLRQVTWSRTYSSPAGKSIEKALITGVVNYQHLRLEQLPASPKISLRPGRRRQRGASPPRSASPSATTQFEQMVGQGESNAGWKERDRHQSRRGGTVGRPEPEVHRLKFEDRPQRKLAVYPVDLPPSTKGGFVADVIGRRIGRAVPVETESRPGTPRTGVTDKDGTPGALPRRADQWTGSSKFPRSSQR